MSHDDPVWMKARLIGGVKSWTTGYAVDMVRRME